MKKLLLLSILGVGLMAAPSAHAAVVRFGVGIGVGPAYVGAAPVCPYGYYNYYPYACAPYGFYGPEWFSGGVFIGSGPWGRGFHGGPAYTGHPGYYARPGFDAHAGFRGGHEYHPAPNAHGPAGNGFHGGYTHEGPAPRDFHGSPHGGPAPNGFHGGRGR